MSAAADIDKLIADILVTADRAEADEERRLAHRLREGVKVLTHLKGALVRLADIRKAFAIPNDVEILDWLVEKFQANQPESTFVTPPELPAPPIEESGTLVERRQRRPKQCARCPDSFVPTGYQQPFCPACVAAIDTEKAETRLRLFEEDPDADKRSESDIWPSSKVRGFPCGSCKQGKKNDLSESGFECTASCARLCAPWGPAWKYERKA